MSQADKQRSHDRIVASASRLFRERGLEGASVADVMEAAGMTHGGFYKHFDSKDALVERALEAAFTEFVAPLGDGDANRAFDAYRSLYLSREHMANPGRGCPVAALGPEIARGSTVGKRAFAAGLRRLVETVARSRRGSSSARRASAIREFALLVGAMIIARASDASFADEVLAACGGNEEARSAR